VSQLSLRNLFWITLSRVADLFCCLRNSLYFWVPGVTHVQTSRCSYRAPETFIHFKNFVTFHNMAYLTSKYKEWIKRLVCCRTEGHFEIFTIFLYLLLSWSHELLETPKHENIPEVRYVGRAVCPYVTGSSVRAVSFVGYFTTLSISGPCSFEFKDDWRVMNLKRILKETSVAELRYYTGNSL
jgi:hypothetical protein